MVTWEPSPGDQLRGAYRADEERPSIETEGGERWAIPEDADRWVRELDPEDGDQILLVFQGTDPQDGLGLYNVASLG